MELEIEVEQEVDGRWIAEATEIPGVLVYGETREKAVAAALELAREVLGDREEHDE